MLSGILNVKVLEMAKFGKKFSQVNQHINHYSRLEYMSINTIHNFSNQT